MVMDFKFELFPHYNDIRITLLCLIVAWVASISRVLVVLHKTNNVVERCQLSCVPFLGGRIFDKRIALFVYQWVPQILDGFS